MWILIMNIKNKLRNNLIRKIQLLSTDKLTEINNFLNDNQLKSEAKALSLAGTWKDIGNDVFHDLTDELHDNRAHDRDTELKY